MTVKLDKNQGVNLDYIVIKVDWDSKLIMPIEAGLLFVKAWGQSMTMNTRNTPPTIQPCSRDFEISFLSEDGYKELLMSSVLDKTPES